MSRLNQDRQNKLEPKRMVETYQKLSSLGFNPIIKGKTEIQFEFQGSTVKFFPYSGWHSGKTIKDGRGFNKLLNQIEEQKS